MKKKNRLSILIIGIASSISIMIVPILTNTSNNTKINKNFNSHTLIKKSNNTQFYSNDTRYNKIKDFSKTYIKDKDVKNRFKNFKINGY